MALILEDFLVVDGLPGKRSTSPELLRVILPVVLKIPIPISPDESAQGMLIPRFRATILLPLRAACGRRESPDCRAQVSMTQAGASFWTRACGSYTEEEAIDQGGRFPPDSRKSSQY